MDFKELAARTQEVIGEFETVEKKPWGAEGVVMELAKQVGELSRQVMSYEGYYMAGRDNLDEYKSSKSHIADELSDILFCIIRLADHYGIDLEAEHLKQMDIAQNHPLMGIKPMDRGEKKKKCDCIRIERNDEM